jgi:anti-sigma regulatory factor (Ser/Thr protein kinase)
MPSRSFPAYAASVPTARGYVTDLLDGWPGQLQETAALLASELATNAVRHGGGHDFDVTVRFGPGAQELWVGVTDRGTGSPRARRPPVTDEHGRGLQLVGLLASRWGVRGSRDSDAKTVWFELAPVPPPRQPA